MKKVYLIIFVILILSVIIGGVYLRIKKSEIKTVTIDQKTFSVELAQTNKERENGLMNRDRLDINAGMLFIFPKSDIQTFWMKNTKIPLDIIWLYFEPSREVGTIVELTTLDMETPKNTPQFTPKNKANYVLELNAATAAENGFKVGDEVKLN